MLKAQIQTINGFSDHTEQNDLIEWISNFKDLDKLFLIHWKTEKMEIFSDSIEEKLNHDTDIIEHGVSITL